MKDKKPTADEPEKAGKPTKATKAQVMQRVEEILRVRLDGAEVWDVREYAREKEQEEGSVWHLTPDAKPLSDGTLWRYIGMADKLIAESCRSSRKKLIRRHLAQRRNLYAKAVSQGDVKAALSVLRDEAELQGLYPPKKIAPTTPNGKKEFGDGLSDAERLAALQALYTRMGGLGGGTGTAALDGQDAAGGPLLGGPGEDSGGRGDAAGQVAGDVTPLFG